MTIAATMVPKAGALDTTVVGGWEVFVPRVDAGESVAVVGSTGAGDVVTCVFTNEKDANIIVEKQTSPDGAPGTDADVRLRGVMNNGSIVEAHLDPGPDGIGGRAGRIARG